MDIVLKDFLTGIGKTVSIRINSKPVELIVGESHISLALDQETKLLTIRYNGEKVTIKGRKTLNSTISANPQEGMYTPEERPIGEKK